MGQKAERLAHEYGFSSVYELLDEYIFDSVCPGICMNTGCNYTTEVEPDNDSGYCEICGTNSVASAMTLVGVI